MQIAGSAGIRFRMEMVMTSSSDASAQRRRAWVGRRRGVLRGLAGAALRAGARAASRARRGRGPGPGARRRAVGPDAVRAERGAQARQSQGPVVFQIGWPPRDRLWFAPLFLATVVMSFVLVTGARRNDQYQYEFYFGQIRSRLLYLEPATRVTVFSGLVVDLLVVDLLRQI